MYFIPNIFIKGNQVLFFMGKATIELIVGILLGLGLLLLLQLLNILYVFFYIKAV
jgi:hypothetical protein